MTRSQLGQKRLARTSEMKGVGVAEEYTITAGMLVSKGECKDTYVPTLQNELPGAISKLYAGDEKAVLRFARTYGKLGYGHRPRLAITGEPLAWIWAHAYLIRACFTLTSLLCDEPDDRDDVLRGYVEHLYWQSPLHPDSDERYLEERYIIQNYEVTYGHDITAYNDRCYQAGGLLPPPPEEDAFAVLHAPHEVRSYGNPPLSPRQDARRMRAGLINRYMGVIRRTLWDRDNMTQSWYALDRTLSAAYWHLANSVEAEKDRLKNVQVRRCASCEAWFLQTHQRQRFCPPTRAKTDSACAARERMRAKRRQSHTDLPFREQY